MFSECKLFSILMNSINFRLQKMDCQVNICMNIAFLIFFFININILNILKLLTSYKEDKSRVDSLLLDPLRASYDTEYRLVKNWFFDKLSKRNPTVFWTTLYRAHTTAYNHGYVCAVNIWTV